MASHASRDRSAAPLVLAGVGLLGVIVLLALIARELLPQHRTASAKGEAPAEVPTAGVAKAAPVGPRASSAAPLAKASGEVLEPAAAPAEKAAPPAPAAAAVLAAVAADPDSFAPESVFRPPVAKTEAYNFESLPGMGAGELKRAKANPAEWELGVLRVPRLTDLAPEGGVHEATTVKDDKGNAVGTWFVVDSGPLAPAFATQQGPTTRVLSRAYVAANKGDFPPEITALLER